MSMLLLRVASRYVRLVVSAGVADGWSGIVLLIRCRSKDKT